MAKKRHLVEAAQEEDHFSDPALNDKLGSDWTDEGGATVYGAATDIELPVPTAREARAATED